MKTKYPLFPTKEEAIVINKEREVVSGILKHGVSPLALLIQVANVE